METTTSSGWVADLSGHGNSGTGASLQTIGGEQGMRSKATRTNGGVNTGMSTALPMGTGSSFTWSVTYKLNSWTATSFSHTSPGNGIFILPRTLSANFASCIVTARLYGGPNLLFTVGSGATITGSSLINLNEWHTTTMTYNGTSFRFYDNGIFQGSISTSGYPDVCYSTFRLAFGGLSPSSAAGGFENNPSDAIYDEVRVYSRALSDSEITALYNATK